MFSTKRRQSIESITESKNVSAWESLISDLETRREDDEMAGDNDNSDGGKGFLKMVPTMILLCRYQAAVMMMKGWSRHQIFLNS